MNFHFIPGQDNNATILKKKNENNKTKLTKKKNPNKPNSTARFTGPLSRG